MREKGTAYSSVPQSVLMSMRNIPITILSLWIPLTPLMWLLYRQASAANSPANKRHPTNQIVSFDDVEGVDTAKAELLELARETISFWVKAFSEDTAKRLENFGFIQFRPGGQRKDPARSLLNSAGNFGHLEASFAYLPYTSSICY